jgi:alpha-L-rhamnosidase
VSGSPQALARGEGDWWDSGKVISSETLGIPYAGKPLDADRTLWWRVRVWDAAGQVSAWSAPAEFSTGLFTEKDWRDAQWIASKPNDVWKTEWDARKQNEFAAPRRDGDGFPFVTQSRMSLWELYAFHEKPYDSAPLLRKVFTLEKPVKRAVVYISGLGCHELRLNGQRVGDHQLDPAWTDYARRVFYVSHDVTRQLQTGRNAVGVMLGRGFYGLLSNDAWNTQNAVWLGQPKLILRLSVEYADGTRSDIVSDPSWKVAGGPIIYDCPRRGEIYDARLEQPGWDTPEFDDSRWAAASGTPKPAGELRSQMMPPIRVTRNVTPISISEPKPGVFVYDMGENISGWARLKLSGPAGTKVLVRYAEKTDREDFFCDNLAIFQEDAYVLDGIERTFEPRFSYKAFRYVQVTGAPVSLTLDSLEGVHVHTDLESTGEFECSNPLLNQIHSAIRLTQLNNTHGQPTDCPHREKQGWMGDGLFGAEAAFWQFDMSRLYAKWVQDMADGQHPNGQMSVFAPTTKIPGEPFTTYAQGMSPIWSSTFPEIAWRVYVQYGDRRILEEHYGAMKRFAESLRKKELPGRPGIVTDAHSDWIPADIPGMRPPEEPTVYGTAYYFRVVNLCARTAKALGKDADAAEFSKWAEDIRIAFDREFFDPERNHYYGHSQTNYRQSVNAIPLHFGMVNAERRKAVGRNLVADIRGRNWHLNTGTVGTRSLMMVLPTLGDDGVEAAWKLATQCDYPSWGHMMRNGATTIWERWQGDSSLNHPAFGSVGGYFYEHLAGIQPSESHPGFEEFDIRPVFPEGLDWVKTRYVSVRGDIKVEWRREGGRLSFNVSVPPGSRARIHVPAANPNGVIEGGRTATPARTTSGMAVFEVGGGDYQFQSDFPEKSQTISN